MKPDGYVVDETTQGIRPRERIFVKGFNVYKHERNGSRCIGHVEEGIAYEHVNGNRLRLRCLGPVENFE